MMLPSHSRKPQAARSLFTSLANSSRRNEGSLSAHSERTLDDPVVLVGGEGLLVAAFGAERRARRIRRRAGRGGRVELEDAAGEGVVEGRDELGELLGADALGESRLKTSWRMSRLRRLRGLDVGGALDAGADLAQTDALQERTGRVQVTPLSLSSVSTTRMWRTPW